MPTLMDVERAAARLRRDLRIAHLPELRVICGLRFFALFDNAHAGGLESYLREFITPLAEAARKSNPLEFLPEETTSLHRLINLLVRNTEPTAPHIDREGDSGTNVVQEMADVGLSVVSSDDLAQFVQLAEAIRMSGFSFPTDGGNLGTRPTGYPGQPQGAAPTGMGEDSSARSGDAGARGRTPATDVSFPRKRESTVNHVGPRLRGGDKEERGGDKEERGGDRKEHGGDKDEYAGDRMMFARVPCLFVEYYPDLDLAPRGRLLHLAVMATPLPRSEGQPPAMAGRRRGAPTGMGGEAPAQFDDAGARGRTPATNSVRSHSPEIGAARPDGTRTHPLGAAPDFGDDIVVRNPVAEPDDRFLAQARDSVAAARAYLAQRNGLSRKKRYRFDFAVDSTGARFTGDSLGVAFAVGAIAAVSKIEVFRERISISPDAAFSGALSAEGKLATIDADALKLKIFRAFHSGLKFLVIPREHLTDAWKYLSELEAEYPGRKLELMGADSLDAVIADPRFLPTERSSRPAYIARKAWKAKRSVWVEAPVFIVLAYLLVCLIYPKAWVFFDRNPAYVMPTSMGFDVLNADSVSLWSETFEWEIDSLVSTWKVGDLNGDGTNEVAFMPKTKDAAGHRVNANLLVYGHKGTKLFRRQPAIFGQYPNDSLSEQLYDPGAIDFVRIGDSTIIVTRVEKSYPARTHIRFWNSNGDSLGWYIHAGQSGAKNECFLSRGRQGLIFLSFNNRMDCACLFVLDPYSSRGVSPPYADPRYALENVQRGNQLHYILFPRSTINRMKSELYNNPDHLAAESVDSLMVQIREVDPPRAAYLNYYLDRNFRVVEVRGEDRFRMYWEQYLGRHSTPTEWANYLGTLRDTVSHWTDSGWVSQSKLCADENLKKFAISAK